jgi:hypothetical protein
VRVGENVLIGGLALQVLTFGFFMGVVGSFHMRVNGGGVEGDGGWKKVLTGVYVSGVLIFVSTFPVFPNDDVEWTLFSRAENEWLIMSADPIRLPPHRVRVGNPRIPFHA